HFGQCLNSSPTRKRLRLCPFLCRTVRGGIGAARNPRPWAELDSFPTERLKHQASRSRQLLQEKDCKKAAVRKLTLNGRWSLSGSGGATALARVPGTVHQDLLRARLLEDPYHRDQ